MSNTKKSQQSTPARKGKKNNNKQKSANKKSANRKITTPGKMAAAPTAIGRVNTTKKPQMKSKPNGDCLIKHREYIQEITGGAGAPSAFKVEGLPINPGMPQTFPWLAQIATRFEKYQFKRLNFLYETEAPTTLGGSLMLGVDYDSSDPAPGSKVQIMSYENSVRSPPWEECQHHSRPMDLSNQKGYYVRDSALQANQDIKLYDTGNLFVSSQNVAVTNSLLGELYVEYEVLLMTPQLNQVQVASTLSGTAGSAASLVTTGQIISGNLISAQVGNLVSFVNLIPGNEYLISSQAATCAAGVVGNQSAPVGLAIKTSLLTQNGGNTSSIATFTATATSGSITLTNGGNVTNILVTIVPLPTLTF